MAVAKIWINNIQRFSIHDGPGIRTTIFFQGCNLKCKWCHNPDAIPRMPVFKYMKSRCLHCGLCVRACPSGALKWDGNRPWWVPERCLHCAACESACPASACAISARCMSVDEVMETVERDMPFYRASSGGITCSGGETMLQTAFLKALLGKAKALHIHTAVDTAALVPWAWFESLFDVTDLFLVDFKVYDEVGHAAATGQSNRLILDNLRRFATCPVPVIIRIPVIPTVNADAESMEQMAAFLSEIGFDGQVELLKFHHLGDSKYDALELENPFGRIKPPEDAEMVRYREIMEKHKLNAVTDV